jgi:predicted cupin superfamily sugar epimerase
MALGAPPGSNAGMNDPAARLIARLGLQRLPGEGGFFRQTWLSSERDAAGRPLGSAILYLMTPEEFSALHRLRMGEVWHFHAGDAVEHVQLDPRDGGIRRARLGPGVDTAEVPQLVVPGGVWQGARLAPGHRRGWSLLGCTLAPAWDERDWEAGPRGALTADFPAAAEIIRALTR